MTEHANLPNELLSYELQWHGFSQQDVAGKLQNMHPEEWELHGELPENFAKKASAKTVRRWEQGISAPSPYYLRRLVTIFNRTAQELGYPEKGIPLWHVPHDQLGQNGFFMDRGDYFSKLHSVVALRNKQYKIDEKTSNAKTKHAILQPQALVGLGGIGKTQIAIEYAYHYAHEYQTVVWLRANDSGTLASDFADIASIVNLPEKDEGYPEKRINAVKDWLMHFTRWLLIFDDAENVEIIRDYLPQKCCGHIIVTTRSAVTGKLAQAIEVEKIPPGESIQFILHRSKATGAEKPGTKVKKEKYAQARYIAKLADGLPLMLEQAGAYIETRGCGLAGYIADYKTQGALVRQKPQLPEKEYSHTVATAWLMSFDKVRQTSPVAADLLSLFAFLAPDGIPEEMITKTAAKLGPVLSTLADNSVALNDAMAVLRSYSLVTRHQETNTCSIHSLVQAVIRDNMEDEEHQMWAGHALYFVGQIYRRYFDNTFRIPLKGAARDEAQHRFRYFLPQAFVPLQYMMRMKMFLKEFIMRMFPNEAIEELTKYLINNAEGVQPNSLVEVITPDFDIPEQDERSEMVYGMMEHVLPFLPSVENMVENITGINKEGLTLEEAKDLLFEAMSEPFIRGIEDYIKGDINKKIIIQVGEKILTRIGNLPVQSDRAKDALIDAIIEEYLTTVSSDTPGTGGAPILSEEDQEAKQEPE